MCKFLIFFKHAVGFLVPPQLLVLHVEDGKLSALSDKGCKAFPRRQTLANQCGLGNASTKLSVDNGRNVVIKSQVFHGSNRRLRHVHGCDLFRCVVNRVLSIFLLLIHWMCHSIDTKSEKIFLRCTLEDRSSGVVLLFIVINIWPANPDNGSSENDDTASLGSRVILRAIPCRAILSFSHVFGLGSGMPKFVGHDIGTILFPDFGSDRANHHPVEKLSQVQVTSHLFRVLKGSLTIQAHNFR
mmetsp:Transcript_11182/g.24963  ORF Transcript_11182/g.24963 Transcript_11182/m.24963 type:complete len:242 (+) Transcript_11182:1406-2131(+)